MNNNFNGSVCRFKKSVFLPPLYGALAQLARVSDWQSGGHGSDSRTLHIVKKKFNKKEKRI